MEALEERRKAVDAIARSVKLVNLVKIFKDHNIPFSPKHLKTWESAKRYLETLEPDEFRKVKILAFDLYWLAHEAKICSKCHGPIPLGGWIAEKKSEGEILCLQCAVDLVQEQLQNKDLWGKEFFELFRRVRYPSDASVVSDEISSHFKRERTRAFNPIFRAIEERLMIMKINTSQLPQDPLLNLQWRCQLALMIKEQKLEIKMDHWIGKIALEDLELLDKIIKFLIKKGGSWDSLQGIVELMKKENENKITDTSSN